MEFINGGGHFQAKILQPVSADDAAHADGITDSGNQVLMAIGLGILIHNIIDLGEIFKLIQIRANIPEHAGTGRIYESGGFVLTNYGNHGKGGGCHQCVYLFLISILGDPGDIYIDAGIIFDACNDRIVISGRFCGLVVYQHGNFT